MFYLKKKEQKRKEQLGPPQGTLWFAIGQMKNKHAQKFSFNLIKYNFHLLLK